MRFTFEKHDYSIVFEYVKDQIEWERSCTINKRHAYVPNWISKSPPPSTLHQPNITKAKLFRGIEGGHLDLLVEGTTACSCKDAYHKKVGRKLAVQDMLQKFDDLRGGMSIHPLTDEIAEFHRRVYAHLFAHRILDGANMATPKRTEAVDALAKPAEK